MHSCCICAWFLCQHLNVTRRRYAGKWGVLWGCPRNLPLRVIGLVHTNNMLTPDEALLTLSLYTRPVVFTERATSSDIDRAIDSCAQPSWRSSLLSH